MSSPFLIPQIPLGAKYCNRSEIVHAYPDGSGYDMKRLLNEVQIVDSRLNSVSDIPESRPELLELFEIKDFQESSRGADALCSICLFDLERQSPKSDKDWNVYLQGLRDWIGFMRSEMPNQKLRVYIADNVWDILHKEQILKSDDVDFVRMQHSSEKAAIGCLWRYLAFDDYRYEYVYIEDTDERGAYVNNKWMNVERIKSTSYVLQSRLYGGAHIGTALTFVDKEAEFFGEENRSHIDFFEWHKIPIYDPVFMCRLTYFCRSCASTMTRGPKRLPFDDIVPMLCYFLDKGNSQIIYHPQANYWSNFHEIPANMGYNEMDEHFLFHLTKILDVGYWIPPEKMFIAQRLMKHYGEDCFLARLYRQLISEGNNLGVFYNEGSEKKYSDFAFDYSDEMYEKLKRR